MELENAVDLAMELARKHSPDQLEAYWSKNRVTTIRMALNDIVEAKTITMEGVSIRLIINKSIGFASTTNLSSESLAKIVEEAYRAAKSKSPDPDFHSLPEPEKAQSPIRYDRRLTELDIEDSVELGYEAIRTARTEGQSLDFSGSINVVVEKCHVRNSFGVDASDISSFIFSSFTVEEGEECSALGQGCSRKLRDFDPVTTVEEVVNGLKKGKGGKMIEPGRYEVILGPHAVAELVEFVLAYSLDLSSVDTGLSYFRGMLGKTVADKSFGLIDDGCHPEGIASKSIDDEGVPTKATTLIDGGVLQNFLCDTYYARKLSSPVREFKSTGNGFRFGPAPGRDYSSLPHVQPTNFVICPGKQHFEDLVEDTKRGIFIGRIWYCYPINPTIGEFSTTNRGDTFYIENGEVKNPILPNSFRIDDRLPRLLKEIQDISREQIQSVVWGGVSSCLSPYIKLGDVNIAYSKGEDVSI